MKGEEGGGGVIDSLTNVGREGGSRGGGVIDNLTNVGVGVGVVVSIESQREWSQLLGLTTLLLW